MPRHTLFATLVLLAATQTGCATLFTATACLASKAKNCGEAIGAAATVDALVIDAAVTASASDEYGYAACGPGTDYDCD